MIPGKTEKQRGTYIGRQHNVILGQEILVEFSPRVVLVDRESAVRFEL